jgi:hypothetical protein
MTSVQSSLNVFINFQQAKFDHLDHGSKLWIQKNSLPLVLGNQPLPGFVVVELTDS